MIKIIERYFFREIFVPYLFCLVITLSILLMGRIVQIARYFLQTSISFSDILFLMILAIPKLSLYALPLVTMLSVTLAVSRMNSDKETIALQASGINFRNLWKPLLAFVLINTLISLIFAIYFMPRSNALFRKKLASIGAASVTALLREGIFIDVIPGFILYFQKVDPGTFTARGVFIEDLRNSKFQVNVLAEKAHVSYNRKDGSVTFSLTNGSIVRISLRKKSKGQAVFFKNYRIILPVKKLGLWKNPVSGGKNEMTMKELKEAAKHASPHFARRFKIEYNLRILLPLSCIVLGFLVLPLFTILRITTILTGVALTILVYLCYYFLISFGKGLAENGIVKVDLAMWFPFVLAGTIAFWFWKSGEKVRFWMRKG